jgi:ATP-binding cassette subfamily B (MDR/TAP) protein 1
MGTVSIANALAFTPNLQKGLVAASRIIRLLKRIPQIKDELDAKDILWVKYTTLHYNKINIKNTILGKWFY